MDTYSTQQICEEGRNGLMIYAEANPDHWRGGFIWTLVDEKTAAITDEGLAFTMEDTLKEARHAADQKLPHISDLDVSDSSQPSICSNRSSG